MKSNSLKFKISKKAFLSLIFIFSLYKAQGATGIPKPTSIDNQLLYNVDLFEDVKKEKHLGRVEVYRQQLKTGNVYSYSNYLLNCANLRADDTQRISEFKIYSNLGSSEDLYIIANISVYTTFNDLQTVFKEIESHGAFQRQGQGHSFYFFLHDKQLKIAPAFSLEYYEITAGSSITMHYSQVQTFANKNPQEFKRRSQEIQRRLDKQMAFVKKSVSDYQSSVKETAKIRDLVMLRKEQTRKGREKLFTWTSNLLDRQNHLHKQKEPPLNIYFGPIQGPSIDPLPFCGSES